jgi:hypothetical protein
MYFYQHLPVPDKSSALLFQVMKVTLSHNLHLRRLVMLSKFSFIYIVVITFYYFSNIVNVFSGPSISCFHIFFVR